MITVETSSKFTSDDAEVPLTLNQAFREWVQALPDHAVLTPITRDKGDQREPWPVLVGLRAAWTETA